MDGNDFGCAGTEQLIQPLIDKAETELREKKVLEEEKIAAEEAAKFAEGEFTTCERRCFYKCCNFALQLIAMLYFCNFIWTPLLLIGNFRYHYGHFYNFQVECG